MPWIAPGHIRPIALAVILRPNSDQLLVFEASLYAAERLTGHEEDGTPFPVRWVSLSDPSVRLYPTGLRELVR